MTQNHICLTTPVTHSWETGTGFDDLGTPETQNYVRNMVGAQSKCAYLTRRLKHKMCIKMSSKKSSLAKEQNMRREMEYNILKIMMGTYCAGLDLECINR